MEETRITFATISLPTDGLGLVLDVIRDKLEREERVSLNWQENLPGTHRGAPVLTSQHKRLKQWYYESARAYGTEI